MNTFKKRIDELGRIVIPKEIRNSIKIKNFDEFELYVEKDSIILKKSVGIEIYKDKLERLISLLSCLLDFKIIITNKKYVIVSNYENIIYKDEIMINTNETNIKAKKISGYMEHLPIIIDSNNVGNIYFISESKFDDKIDLLKKIRSIVVDLIN